MTARTAVCAGSTHDGPRAGTAQSTRYPRCSGWRALTVSIHSRPGDEVGGVTFGQAEHVGGIRFKGDA